MTFELGASWRPILVFTVHYPLSTIHYCRLPPRQPPVRLAPDKPVSSLQPTPNCQYPTPAFALPPGPQFCQRQCWSSVMLPSPQSLFPSPHLLSRTVRPKRIVFRDNPRQTATVRDFSKAIEQGAKSSPTQNIPSRHRPYGEYLGPGCVDTRFPLGLLQRDQQWPATTTTRISEKALRPPRADGSNDFCGLRPPVRLASKWNSKNRAQQFQSVPFASNRGCVSATITGWSSGVSLLSIFTPNTQLPIPNTRLRIASSPTARAARTSDRGVQKRWLPTLPELGASRQPSCGNIVGVQSCCP